MDILYLVVPCYNEEQVLPETSFRLREKLVSLINRGMISTDSRILFVDDGSRDRTWEIISKLASEQPIFAGVKLSRNRGHQNALLAGLSVAKDHCDMAISMDADLQDDIGAVDAFIERYHEGCDIVYGVRSSRATDTAFKRESAGMFYRLMRGLGVEIVDNHADYRLMSRRALEALMQFEESNLFLRGIIPQIGFRSAIVPYERGERFAGESKYPLGKMLSFALDGITSFSVRPLRLITVLGILMAFFGFLGCVVFWLIRLLGWWLDSNFLLGASLWLVGGIQVTCLGVVGEYIGKIYKETKHRPRFIIEEISLRA